LATTAPGQHRPYLEPPEPWPWRKAPRLVVVAKPEVQLADRQPDSLRIECIHEQPPTFTRPRRLEGRRAAANQIIADVQQLPIARFILHDHPFASKQVELFIDRTIFARRLKAHDLPHRLAP